ncbi:hypothetical protein ES706_02376 [subsurface metagenome]
MAIILEKEGLRLRVLKEALPPGVEFSAFMREVMGRAATRQAVDYGKNVTDWIVACRVDGGLPLFKTRFAGERYPEGHVLAVCWAGRGLIEGQWFNDVPREDIEMMESKHGEWKDILRERGTSGQVDRAMKAPLILTSPPEGLPPRGTGLETGRAGERRADVPRTEEERRIRHLGMNPGVRRLPTVTIREKKYYLDARLREYRAVDDPHDRIPLEPEYAKLLGEASVGSAAWDAVVESITEEKMREAEREALH